MREKNGGCGTGAYGQMPEVCVSAWLLSSCVTLTSELGLCKGHYLACTLGATAHAFWVCREKSLC